MKVPCITLREQTEWVETLKEDANIIVGTNIDKILSAVDKVVEPEYENVFGDGNASEKILKFIPN